MYTQTLFFRPCCGRLLAQKSERCNEHSASNSECKRVAHKYVDENCEGGICQQKFYWRSCYRPLLARRYHNQSKRDREVHKDVDTVCDACREAEEKRVAGEEESETGVSEPSFVDGKCDGGCEAEEKPIAQEGFEKEMRELSLGGKEGKG